MQIEDVFTKCSEFSDDIMDRISNLLSENNIDYTTQNDYEIVVHGKTKTDIKNVINADDTFDPHVIKVLLSITESSGNTYIRQKYN